ncbi:hypothetical protein OSB04_004706 [Centaurea solstitialis]|uniref:Morc S5 domain-containing protein n=1 Tax=Centaurea solstitialis TaxID=347529 RepID=A0AA38TSH7_9ASTR|nr:hypothetical protein OSB04_004706 [Centaurea solstitialis]
MAAGVEVKREIETLNDNSNTIVYSRKKKDGGSSGVPAVIDLGSSDDDDDESCSSGNNGKRPRVLSGGGDEVRSKKKKSGGGGGGVAVAVVVVVVWCGFWILCRIRRRHCGRRRGVVSSFGRPVTLKDVPVVIGVHRQKFEIGRTSFYLTYFIYTGGMDHLRVHPRFLHSNATSHKWVLGAFAELLDNALDETCNGATYVNIDMLTSRKDENRMLLIEDNGGGMDPDKMRQCMSLGYSLKSKVTDAIGQYGNGFKTSTMRLGADVIVFSRSPGKDGKRSTQSIGLLSYTFLRSTGKEDIVVPMSLMFNYVIAILIVVDDYDKKLDYERSGKGWKKMKRLTPGDWDINIEAIIQWSPFSSEADLLRQFDQMKDQGTRIIIYNLWEDDRGELELDFDADKHDIQIRGVNRDEASIEMAQKYPNSRHFLTYRHSLRSYASILYLRVPYGFRMILRGKDVQHHNIINDMMMTNEVTYRPQPGVDGVPKDSNVVALVTVGFVKDATAHIDVQGFNVYHKNRLIKPFWRLWNAAGSDGRGVIGVLEANFVEPAHDKQGFERTNVLSRLESRLIIMQKNYWNTHCHKIGYAPRRKAKRGDDRESSDYTPEILPTRRNAPSKMAASYSDNVSFQQNQKQGGSPDPDYRPEIPRRKTNTPRNIPVSQSDKVSSHQNQKQDYTPEIPLAETSAPTKTPVSHSDKAPLPQNQNQGGSDYAPEIPLTKASAPSETPVSHSDKVSLDQNQNQGGFFNYTPEIPRTEKSAPSKTPVSRSDKVSSHQNQQGGSDYTPEIPFTNKSVPSKTPVSHSDKASLHQKQNQGGIKPTTHPTEAVNSNDNIGENRDKSQRLSGVAASSSESTTPFSGNIRGNDLQTTVTTRDANGSSQKGFSAQRSLSSERTFSRESALEIRRAEPEKDCTPSIKSMQVVTPPPLRSCNVNGNVAVSSNYDNPSYDQLMEENRELKKRLRRREEEILGELVQDLECVRTRCTTLEAEVEKEKEKNDILCREQESIIAIFTEERERRDAEEIGLRKKLKDAEARSKSLLEKVKQLQLENMSSMGHKWGKL